MAARPEVLGAIMVGSAARATGDHKSDRDIEVVVADDFYDRRDVDELVRRDGVEEFLLVPERDFLQRKHSPRDIDHWPYQHCVLLFDRRGIVAAELPLISAMNENMRARRLELHAFEFLFCSERIGRLHDCGKRMEAALMAAQACMAAVRLIFVHAWLWPPLYHAVGEELEWLPDVGGRLSDAIAALLASPADAAAADLKAAVAAQVGASLPETPGDAYLLTCTVTAADFRPWRELYGSF